MAQYLNPHHPCGYLHPQESGFLAGGGGYQQSREDMRVVVQKTMAGVGALSRASDMEFIGVGKGQAKESLLPGAGWQRSAGWQRR